jgi:hypothetical protein
MGIPLLAGRAFTTHDDEKAPLVAIVSQSYAFRHFPGEDPIGKRISMSTHSDAWREIVGVVGDVKNRLLDPDSLVQMYEPFAQHPWRSFSVIVRSHGPMPALPTALKNQVYAMDRGQPLYRLSPLEELVGDSVRLVSTGLVLGVGTTFITSRLIAQQLYGVSAHDPLVYGGIVMMLTLVALVASWLPAHRAARVDPMVALRSE